VSRLGEFFQGDWGNTVGGLNFETVRAVSLGGPAGLEVVLSSGLTKLGRELGLPFGCVPVEVPREVFVEVLGGSLLGEAQGGGSLGEAQGVAMVVPGDVLQYSNFLLL
jgi:hypothetical protein